MPEEELRPQFAGIGEIRLQDLSNLKLYWHVSIAALLTRASDLGYLAEGRKRYLWSTMSKLGWRLKEPNPLPAEEPTTLRKMLKHFGSELKYSSEDLAAFLKVNLRDLRELHGEVFSQEPPKARLRVVS